MGYNTPPLPLPCRGGIRSGAEKYGYNNNLRKSEETVRIRDLIGGHVIGHADCDRYGY